MSAFKPNAVLLLLLTSAVTAATTSATKKLRTAPDDDQSNAEQGFAAVFNLTAAGGSSPLLDAVVETSWDDGVNWHTVAAMTQLSGAGTKKQLVDIDHLGPLVRAVITPGGSTPGSTTGAVRLLTSGLLES